MSRPEVSVDWWSYGLWGFLATAVLAGVVFTAQQLGLTRISMPFLLGSAWTADRRKAKVIGVAAHVVNGMVFALLYVLGFELLGRATWWIGALGGVLHTFVVLTLGMEILTALHPYMADARQGPTPTRWLQPPGFLALNYGHRTPLVALAAHLIYGALLGGFYRV